MRGLRFLVFGFVLLLAACSSRVELISANNEGEANEILTALLDSGVQAQKSATKTGYSVTVGDQEVARSLNILHARGLPRESFAGLGQIFQKEGLVSSPLEERARYIYALSQELSNTLSQMDGVLVARVHVVLPERGGINEEPIASTAAVFIKHQAGISLDALKPQIRQLVTHAIPGLTEDRVSVTLVSAQPVPADLGVANPTTQVLGFQVARASATSLSIVLGLLILIVLALGGALAYLFMGGRLPGMPGDDSGKRHTEKVTP